MIPTVPNTISTINPIFLKFHCVVLFSAGLFKGNISDIINIAINANNAKSLIDFIENFINVISGAYLFIIFDTGSPNILLYKQKKQNHDIYNMNDLHTSHYLYIEIKLEVNKKIFKFGIMEDNITIEEVKDIKESFTNKDRINQTIKDDEIQKLIKTKSVVGQNNIEEKIIIDSGEKNPIDDILDGMNVPDSYINGNQTGFRSNKDKNVYQKNENIPTFQFDNINNVDEEDGDEDGGGDEDGDDEEDGGGDEDAKDNEDNKIDTNKKSEPIDKRKQYMEKMRYFNNLKRFKSEGKIGVPEISSADTIDTLKEKHDSYVESLRHKSSLVFYRNIIIGAAWIIEKANNSLGFGFNLDRFAKHIDDSSVEYEELLSLMIDDHQLPEPNPMYQIIIKFVTSMFLYHQMNVTRNIRIKIKEESEKKFGQGDGPSLPPSNKILQELINEAQKNQGENK